MQKPLAKKEKKEYSENPQATRMTLCIAAECWHGETPCIVSCCDTRAERGGVFQELVGSEDVDKLRDFGSITGLLSGDPTAADRLMSLCEQTIETFAGCTVPADDFDIEVTKYLKGLEMAAESRKGEIVDHHLGMTLRMPFQDFVKNHKAALTETHGREIWNEIKLIDLGTDVIFGGFMGRDDPEPVLVRLDRYGKAHWEDNYSVVGIGADIALAFLCQRDWYKEDNSRLQLIDCLYRVYEAKAAAQKNRHVGESTAFEILMPIGKRYDVTDECFKELKRRFSLRMKSPDLSKMNNFFKEIEGEHKSAINSPSDSVIIPMDQEDTKGRKKSFGRFRAHDAMPEELRGIETGEKKKPEGV